MQIRALLLALLATLPGCVDDTYEGRASSPIPIASPSPDLIVDVPFLHPTEIVSRGTDLLSDRYDPTRIGKPLEEIDTTFDYDFVRLHEAEALLQGIDRRAVLKQIFDVVTEGLVNDTEKHVAILNFLQEASVHSPYLQPMYEDRTTVTDPLVLLALNEMRCGHVAMVAVDLFEAGGYRGRLVQLGGHIIAEIEYGQKWHYLDADLFGGGDVVRNANGTIPSVAQLSALPSRIDAIPSYSEALLGPGGGGKVLAGFTAPYPSFFYFGRAAYTDLPRYVWKSGSPEASAASRYYGWEYVQSVRATDIVLHDLPMRTTPSPVRFVAAEQLADGRILVGWEAVVDDGDLSGYRILVGTRSRGWHYKTFSGEPVAASHWSGQGANGLIYPAIFDVPPDDVASYVFAESATQAVFGPFAESVYVSVMPIDAYGESIGRELYPLAEELRF